KALGKDRRGIKEADSGVTIAGSRDILAIGGEELVDGRAVDLADHVSCFYVVDGAAHDDPVAVDGISDEANRLAVGLVQPFVVKPGVPVMQPGHELHGREVEV